MPTTHHYNLPESKRYLIDYRHELKRYLDDPKTLSALAWARENIPMKGGVVQHDSRPANH